MNKTTLGRRMFWSVLAIFLVFAVFFITFQQMREKEYKIETLNFKLQSYNSQLCEAMLRSGNDEKTINDFLSTHLLQNVRVTMTDTLGRVLYDNKRKDYAHIRNHKKRKEIREALRVGTGYDISRNSESVGGDFFYSATYFPDEGIVIRSALPYDNNLANSLKADQHFLWFALAVVAVLTAVLYRFIWRLDSNVTKLRIFARRADHNESLDTEDLVAFPADELGEISEHIIKIYKRLQKTKEEQNVLKRQLTQNIAHELKTPVASIQGYLETILTNPGLDENLRKQFLDRCYAQSRRLASLLGDISTLNRLDDAPELNSLEDVDIARIFEQITTETALDIKRKGMNIVCHMPESLPIHGNQSLIYSIFRNLVDNAIAYAGEGTTITLEASEGEDSTWHFMFCDNGVGVPGEHLPRLFERFYRVDKGRSRKMGGTGLGLAIVKNAVQFHGGAIVVANRLEGGLRFDFSLRKDVGKSL
jgi:signal transduction histidine kinase